MIPSAMVLCRLCKRLTDISLTFCTACSPGEMAATFEVRGEATQRFLEGKNAFGGAGQVVLKYITCVARNKKTQKVRPRSNKAGQSCFASSIARLEGGAEYRKSLMTLGMHHEYVVQLQSRGNRPKTHQMH